MAKWNVPQTSKHEEIINWILTRLDIEAEDTESQEEYLFLVSLAREIRDRLDE